MLLETNVIAGAYLHDILEQPDALQRTLSGLDRHADLVKYAGDLAGARYSRVVLTGMGSSLFALYPLHLRLTQHGYSSLLMETAELIHFLPTIFDAHTLIIAVSQSGQSAEIVRLTGLAHGRCKLIAVTNSASSTLAQQADVTLLIQAGPESSVSCKTYVSSLMALQWLGAVLTAGDLAAENEALSSCIPAVRHYLAEWREHVAELSSMLNGIRQIFVTGRGPSLATAQTGGLILKESTRFGAEGLSSPAFRHGPFEVLSRDVLVIIMAGGKSTEALNRTLANDVDQAGGRSALVSTQAELAAFRISPLPDSVRPIAEILPVQMLSLALAASRGIEAGKFSLATKVTSVE